MMRFYVLSVRIKLGLGLEVSLIWKPSCGRHYRLTGQSFEIQHCPDHPNLFSDFVEGSSS